MQKARRLVLSMLAAGSLVPLLGARRLLAAVPRAWPAPPLAARLAALFSAPESAAILGRAYLAEAPAEADPDGLVARILPESSARELAALDGERLRALVAERQRGDFAAGRTFVLDGWVLSRTELRLCALAALSRPVG
jgi:hypothetical protein